MNIQSFWSLIDRAKAAAVGDPEAQLDELATMLEALSAQEIVDFQHLVDGLFHLSYTWPLWGAAYVIAGGCSDDGFDYFRGWLISRGEETFTRTVANPDGLAAVIDANDEAVACQVEGWQSVGVDAWCAKTGADYSAFPKSSNGASALEPSGEPWAEDDLQRLFPRLSARFG
jgi:hypothetical protein